MGLNRRTQAAVGGGAGAGGRPPKRGRPPPGGVGNAGAHVRAVAATASEAFSQPLVYPLGRSPHPLGPKTTPPLPSRAAALCPTSIAIFIWAFSLCRNRYLYLDPYRGRSLHRLDYLSRGRNLYLWLDIDLGRPRARYLGPALAYFSRYGRARVGDGGHNLNYPTGCERK